MLNLICKLSVKFYLWLSTIELDKLYRIADKIGGIAAIAVLFDYHKNTRVNMASAFPEKDKDELRMIRKAYFKMACHFAVETASAISFSQEEMRKRMTYKNIDLLRKLLDEHKYVVCYSGHVANYEWMTGLPLEIPGYGMCNFYKSTSIENNLLADFIKRKRGRFGARLIPTCSPLREIVNYRDEIENKRNEDKGFVIGSLSDMYDDSDNAHIVKLFNWSFRPYTGTERIGRRLNAAFLYGKISCRNRGFYEMTFEQLQPEDSKTNPFAYTDDFFRHLEKNIREHPELWMMWGERIYK